MKPQITRIEQIKDEVSERAGEGSSFWGWILAIWTGTLNF